MTNNLATYLGMLDRLTHCAVDLSCNESYAFARMSHVMGQAAWGAVPESATTELNPSRSRLRYASIARRAVAQTFDLLTGALLTFVLAVPLIWGIEAVRDMVGISEVRARSATGTLVVLMWLVISWLYDARSVGGKHSATLGKRMMGICVTDESGERIGFGQATVRYCAKFLSAFALMAGFAAAIKHPCRQTLHDRVAGTVVVER